MLGTFNTYFKQHPDFWNYLVSNPILLENLILNPQLFELYKSNYKSHQQQQMITKVQNLGLLLRMVEATRG